jgi:LmbE family N-acetylglucosaminyl deacetylase
VSADVDFLSPHLDDAVLSAGALLARRAAAGRRVEVWTFFSQGPALADIPPDRRVFGDYATRLAEDERALARLGVQHRRLGFVERIWREPTLTSTLQIFHTPAAHEELVNVDAMRAIVGEAIDLGAEVYAPLGVGNHVDHVEVALAATRELIERRAWDRLRFYEDPYALGAVCRHRHHVTRQRRWPFGRGPGWASPRVAALLGLVAASMRGPNIDAYLPAAAALTWSCEAVAVDGFEDAKLAAIAEYGSQVTAFGGMARLAPFLRRAHRLLGGEPIWRARDTKA